MPEPKCRWCKDTRVVQLLTTVAPCTDCPTQWRVKLPQISTNTVTVDTLVSNLSYHGDRR